MANTPGRGPQLVLALALSLAPAVRAPAQQPVAASDLTDAQREHLRAEQWASIVSVATLPAEVREALRDLFRSSTLALADPGQEFQVTDVIMKPDLPIRRLVLAGCSTDHCVVYYERGGIAHTFSVVLLRRDQGTAKFEWGGAAPRNVATLDELKTLILAGKIKGGQAYW